MVLGALSVIGPRVATTKVPGAIGGRKRRKEQSDSFSDHIYYEEKVIMKSPNIVHEWKKINP